MIRDFETLSSCETKFSNSYLESEKDGKSSRVGRAMGMPWLRTVKRCSRLILLLAAGKPQAAIQASKGLAEFSNSIDNAPH